MRASLASLASLVAWWCNMVFRKPSCGPHRFSFLFVFPFLACWSADISPLGYTWLGHMVVAPNYSFIDKMLRAIEMNQSSRIKKQIASSQGPNFDQRMRIGDYTHGGAATTQI